MDTAGSPPPLRGRPDASDTRQHHEGEQPLRGPDLVSDWEKLIYTLTTISQDLSKEEDIAPRKAIARNLQDAIGQVHAINAKVTRPNPGTTTDKRLSRIEASLKQLTKATPQAAPRGQTWAAIAATQASRSITQRHRHERQYAYGLRTTREQQGRR
jgi:hypothetical protein